MFEPDNSRISSDESHAAMMGRVESSIMGESALIDRETNRVYWEGGASSTLHETFGPKLDQYGADHIQTALLTGFITLAFLGVVSAWMRRGLDESKWIATASSESAVLSLLLTTANWTIMRLPKIENKWLVLISTALYFFESYNCTTRHYLANAIASPELENYIESLRQEKPVVTWKMSSFHYEMRKLFTLPNLVFSILRRQFDTQQISSSDDAMLPRVKKCKPAFPFTKKVVTHQATTTYEYEKCLDSTMAGVWRRASVTATTNAPFTKIAVTVLLVLANKKSREDYFSQQADFVNQHGRGDEFTQFSTDIQVKGFRPSLLAVRPVKGVLSTTLFRLHMFWFFTFLGLTLPYRIWFKRHCEFLRVTVVKETSSTSSKRPSSYYPRWLPSRATINPHASHFRSFMQGQSLYASTTTASRDTEGAGEGGDA